jgi:hypothetical protein
MSDPTTGSRRPWPGALAIHMVVARIIEAPATDASVYRSRCTRPAWAHTFRVLVAAAFPLVLLLGAASSVGAQSPESAIPEELRTHAERSGWTELTPHAEVVRFYNELARLSPDARLMEIGTSREGRPIQLVTLSRPAVAEPWEAHASGKPIYFIGAQVHGDEPAGKEGLMLFARELAFGSATDLLDDVVFLFIPQINPDAAEAGQRGTRANPAGYNVNRDYSRLVNPESRTMVTKVFNPWRPHVMVDAHELTGLIHGNLHPGTVVMDLDG